MRLLALAACAALAGCSGVYMPNSVTMNSEIEPLPADYLRLVRDRVPEAVVASEPQRMNSWSIYEAAGWYVCVRTAAGDESALVIEHDRVQAAIAKPGPVYCGKAVYRSLT